MRWPGPALLLAAAALVGCESAPVASSAAPQGKSCVQHVECGATEVCAGAAGSRHCSPELARSYRITLEKATDFSSYGDDGKPWDADGSGPDPYAILAQSTTGGAEKELCRTTSVNSTDAPSWNLPCTATLATGSDLTFSVWDEDGEKDANMLQASLTMAELLDILRNDAGIGKAKATARLWFKIEAL